MGTTTKMAIPYPEATGLVKDGWEDMKDIANQVDAKSGLVLLNTSSFTSSSGVVVTQFNANYENYRAIFRIDAHNTTSGNHNLRMRSGATDATGSDYFCGGFFSYANSASSNSFAQNAQTTLNVGSGVTTATMMYYVFDFITPFLAKKTGISGQVWAENSTYSYGAQWNAVHNLATSYDGFNLYPAAGTLTGKVAIYGYNF